MKLQTSTVPRQVLRDRTPESGPAAPPPASGCATGAPLETALIEDATVICMALQAYQNWSGRPDAEAQREARMAFQLLKDGCNRLVQHMRRHHPD